MMDLIFATRVYDLGYISGWRGVGDLVGNLFNAKSTNYASMWAKFEKKARKDLEKALEVFDAPG